MNPLWTYVVLSISVIASSLVAGLFLTFSDFVMRSLALAKSGAGIEVMQIINREIGKSISIFLLWGMVALSVILVGYAYFFITGPVATWVISGGIFYFVGVLIVSYLFNIPMNEKLDAMQITAPESVLYWNESYVNRWVFWNYIRAISAGSAAICFLVACIVLSQNPILKSLG